MNNFLIIFFLVVILAATASSEDKIYTNEDLKPEPLKSSNSSYSLAPLLKSSDFNHSFDELNKYIKDKIAQIRIPEYGIYLHPLSGGLSIEQVQGLWGKKTTGGLHEENENKTWIMDTRNYEIGVILYFELNKLKGWKTFAPPPRIHIPKDAKVINYKDLEKGLPGGEGPELRKKNESARGVKESSVFGENEEVLVSIKGCPTLQDTIDGKEGKTDAVFSVLGHGRTVEEICETVGQGCKSCGEASLQTRHR